MLKGKKTMRRLFLFMNISLDGYFEGPQHDLSFFTRDFEAFSSEKGRQVDTMLFGHRTYEMMKSFWPTPQAQQVAPEIAEFINQKRKLVASHQPFDPGWKNVEGISGDVCAEVKKLMEGPGDDIMIFGSNQLCASLVQADRVDELQLMVNPVVIGAGTPLLKGLPGRADFVLADTHPFKSGVVLMTYRPAKG